MSIFTKVVDFISGGIGEKIIDTVRAQFPPKMSEAEKQRMEAAIREASRQHELALLTLAREEEEEFNSRIKELEGTASDLTQAGFLGKIIIFLRGSQRPLWGYFVLFMDIMVFSGQWVIKGSEINGVDLQSAFWIINVLVLGFLFGERAVRNVAPIFQNQFDKNKASAQG